MTEGITQVAISKAQNDGFSSKEKSDAKRALIKMRNKDINADKQNRQCQLTRSLPT